MVAPFRVVKGPSLVSSRAEFFHCPACKRAFPSEVPDEDTGSARTPA
jgi:hypothetical protein